MTLNCITIDDEPFALNLINSFVEKTSFLQLKASYNSASDALIGLKHSDIHLVFLDIHMPVINGIDIARMLHNTAGYLRPRIIFSTAYNQFAVESYQVEALDYLLKPFDYEEFFRAARKGITYFESLSAPLQPKEEALYVRTGYQQVKVLFRDIKYIRGLRDYVTIYLKNTDKPVMTLSTLKSLNNKLPSDRFIRVQRSYIVSIDSVTAISTNSLWIEDLEITIGEQHKSSVQTVFVKML